MNVVLITCYVKLLYENGQRMNLVPFLYCINISYLYKEREPEEFNGEGHAHSPVHGKGGNVRGHDP